MYSTALDGEREREREKVKKESAQSTEYGVPCTVLYILPLAPLNYPNLLDFLMQY
jgi:hypothetical protein